MKRQRFIPGRANSTCKGPVACWKNQGRLLWLECKKERESVAHDRVREVRRDQNMQGPDGYFKGVHFLLRAVSSPGFKSGSDLIPFMF